MNDSQDNSTRSRVGLLAAAAVVAVIALLAVFVIFSGDDDTPPTGGPQKSPTTEPTSGGHRDPAASVCGLAASDAPLTSAPETRWELIGKLAAPRSTSAGPGLDSNNVRSCFARSQEGALFAAASIYTWNPPRDYEALIECCIAAGPGVAPYRSAAAAAPPYDLDESGPQISAFQIRSFTPDRALVTIALSAGPDRHIEQNLDLVWERGDWRLVLGDDGEFMNMPHQIPDLAGLIPWSGV